MARYYRRLLLLCVATYALIGCKEIEVVWYGQDPNPALLLVSQAAYENDILLGVTSSTELQEEPAYPTTDNEAWVYTKALEKHYKTNPDSVFIFYHYGKSASVGLSDCNRPVYVGSVDSHDPLPPEVIAAWILHELGHNVCLRHTKLITSAMSYDAPGDLIDLDPFEWAVMRKAYESNTDQTTHPAFH